MKKLLHQFSTFAINLLIAIFRNVFIFELTQFMSKFGSSKIYLSNTGDVLQSNRAKDGKSIELSFFAGIMVIDFGLLQVARS